MSLRSGGWAGRRGLGSVAGMSNGSFTSQLLLLENAPLPAAKRRQRIQRRCGVAAACLLCLGASHATEPTVSGTIDGVISRMRTALGEDELLRLDERAVQRFVTTEDRAVLSTQHWHFEASVPVVVSVMRDVQQAEVPFWLTGAGFQKTELTVANEEYQYEVWQKRFDAGRVGLGINGFAKHRPHYFVCVGPARAGDRLVLRDFFPASQEMTEMRQGATIYHDWSELVLTKVPDQLKGQKLLPTTRGRAREAHLVQAFRKTPFPSSSKPDQVMLTWSESPSATQTIQWRSRHTTEIGTVRYKEKGANPAGSWRETQANLQMIEDRLLVSDARVSHYTATLRELKPATAYVYTVGGLMADSRSDLSEFTTAPAGDAPFTFVFLSDTHNSPASGQLLDHALKRHPETAFCAISGDLVGTGQYRDDWDQFFYHIADFARRRPVMPAIGNHDALDGLGADLYLSFFGLPTNGTLRLQPERSYSFHYANALFVVLDATASVADQKPWLAAQLAGTKATWKFVIFHFPPYNPHEPYPDIQREWCPIFDTNHVDFVLSGHVHYYLRTHPLQAGRSVRSAAEGTTYLVTVSVPGRARPLPRPAYAAVTEHAGLPLYQVFTIDGKRLVTRACDLHGNTRDELVIQK